MERAHSLRWATGDSLEEAIQTARRALRVAKQSFKPSHINVADTLLLIGALERRAERWSLAEVVLERALAIYEMHHGHVHPTIARILMDLADLSRRQSRPGESWALRKRAIEVLLAMDDLSVTYSDFYRFATSSDRCDDGADAPALYERIISHIEPKGWPVDVILGCFARQLSRLSIHQSAEQYLRRAIEIDDTSAYHHSALADVLRKQNRPVEAIQQYCTAASLMAADLSHPQPSVVDSPSDDFDDYESMVDLFLVIRDLARLYRDTNNITDAEKSYHRCLDLYEAFADHRCPDNPCFKEIGEFYLSTSNIKAYLYLIDLAKSVALTAICPEDPVEFLSSVAASRISSHQWASALSLYRDIVALCRRIGEFDLEMRVLESARAACKQSDPSEGTEELELQIEAICLDS
jgi:tetratricopeptide (TPR) repeat protein